MQREVGRDQEPMSTVDYEGSQSTHHAGAADDEPPEQGSERSSASLVFTDRHEATAVLGARDQFLRKIRDALGVRAWARAGRVYVEGEPQRVERAVRVLRQLRELADRHGPVAEADVERFLDEVRAEVAPAQAVAVEVVKAKRWVRPKTDGQRRYVEAMRSHEIVLCIGPAGTGKTYLAVAVAVDQLLRGLTRKIVLVRPAVEAGEKLGFLPGDVVAKVNPYLRPLLDALHDLLDFDQIQRYMAADVIEVVPLAYMRGRTLNNATIILDEGQNTTVAQMKMFLTRMGENSRIIVTGDVTQIDLPPTVRSGLVDAVRRLARIPGIAVVRLGNQDIVRHPLVQAIVDAYEAQSDRHGPSGSASQERPQTPKQQ